MPFLNLIVIIDEFKGAWRALGRLAPERMTALRRVATIESIGSSARIEEGKLSNLSITRFETRDEQEVAGYAELMDLVFSSWPEIPVSENYIKQLHQILLRHSEKMNGIAATTTPVVASLPELSLRIIEFTREQGRITIGEATRLTGASRNTLKQHFRALVERGYLSQQGGGRGAWYQLG